MDKDELIAYLETKKELKHREAVSKNELKHLFQRTCINAYPAKDANHPDHSRLYLRTDLSQWAKEAFNRGESYFYIEPVDPKCPCGKLRLCEPKYVYKLTRGLSEKEFAILFEK